jgi:hypothetical protein
MASPGPDGQEPLLARNPFLNLVSLAADFGARGKSVAEKLALTPTLSLGEREDPRESPCESEPSVFHRVRVLNLHDLELVQTDREQSKMIRITIKNRTVHGEACSSLIISTAYLRPNSRCEAASK